SKRCRSAPGRTSSRRAARTGSGPKWRGGSGRCRATAVWAARREARHMVGAGRTDDSEGFSKSVVMATATDQDTAVPGNAESRSAELLQNAVDQAAFFNLFSRPAHANGSTAIGGPRGVVGLHIEEALHRFQVVTRPPGAAT